MSGVQNTASLYGLPTELSLAPPRWRDSTKRTKLRSTTTAFAEEEDSEDVLENESTKTHGEDDKTRTKTQRYGCAALPTHEFTYSLTSSGVSPSHHAMTNDFRSVPFSIVRLPYHIVSDLTLSVISSKHYLHNSCFNHSLLSHTFFPHTFPNTPVVSTLRSISLPSLNHAFLLVHFYKRSDTLLFLISSICTAWATPVGCLSPYVGVRP